MVIPPPDQDCSNDPDALLREGIALFNAHEFFKCHEVLEEAWLAEQQPIRTLYKGVLQIGVGCLHIERNNYRGAIAKLESGMQYLQEFSPICQTVEIARLIADTQKLLHAIQEFGPNHLQEIDLTMLPIIQYSMV